MFISYGWLAGNEVNREHLRISNCSSASLSPTSWLIVCEREAQVIGEKGQSSNVGLVVVTVAVCRVRELSLVVSSSVGNFEDFCRGSVRWRHFSIPVNFFLTFAWLA